MLNCEITIYLHINLKILLGWYKYLMKSVRIFIYKYTDIYNIYICIGVLVTCIRWVMFNACVCEYNYFPYLISCNS